tara:strand:+ start:6803 stop:8374 length:1572 start_codon:yes stop_codon:yes gene_type:complete
MLEALILTNIYILLDNNNDNPISIWAGSFLTSNLISTVIFTSTLIILLTWALLRLCRTRLQAITKYNLYKNQVREITQLYFSLPGKVQLKEQNEDIANLIIHLSGVGAAYSMSILGLLSSVLAVFILAAIAAYNSITITIIAVFLGILSMAINFKNFRTMKDIGSDKIEAQEEVLFKVNQNIRAFELIRYDDWEQTISRQMEEIITRDSDWRINKRKTAEKITVLSDSFGFLSLLIVVSIAVMVIDIKVELLLILLLLFSRLRGHIGEAQTHWTNLNEFKPGTTQLLSAIKRLSAYKQQPFTDLKRISNIAVENVHFSHDNNLVLQNINLMISQGEKILLTGPSGEGKSTMLKILSGYYTPDEGIITYNNKYKTPNLKTVYNSMFYSSNDLYIPNTTIRKFMDPEKKFYDSQLLDALKVACLPDLCTNGITLDSFVGENATNLSLGQRQRLLMARIFLKKPSLVILDEATSNLDPKTEVKLLNNVAKHVGIEATVILASHHSPDWLPFDKHLEVNKGKLKAVK